MEVEEEMDGGVHYKLIRHETDWFTCNESSSDCS